MSDYIRYRRDHERPENSGSYYRNSEYQGPDYGTHSRDRYGRPYDENMNTGYSSYGAREENPYRGNYYPYDRRSGDEYEGNFSGSNYDRDYDFGFNRRGRQQYYGQYNSLDYDDIDRRHDWHPSSQRDRNNPGSLGVGSNYAYNRGGYGSNFGGEYGHFPHRDRGYSGEFGSGRRSQGWGYGNPDRNYSSYSGRFDKDYERSWERDNRDWWDRTRDEVASWFGDEGAERRRRLDRYEANHRGRGPKGYQRSDNRIEEDINERLSDDGWVDASDVSLQVQNGEVVLSGTVPDRFSKRRAEDICESVSGVRQVENRIRVSYQDIPEAGSDRNDRGMSSKQGSVSNGRTSTRPAL